MAEQTTHTFFRLSESYRDKQGIARQRMVLGLGRLLELPDFDHKILWKIYNLIREIEYTFRVLKTDLDLRPVYHKTDEASMAHLHLGLPAYWIVSTIRYQLKQQGINHGWSEIVRIMNTQKMVTTTIENTKGDTIQIRQCSEPTQAVQLICNKLKYRQIPLPRKKSVWHTGGTFKNQKSDCQIFMDG